MRWSKLRKLVIERFAEPLKSRIDIHSAAYGACTCGHFWITLDGEVIANFCTRAHAIAQGYEPSDAKPNAMYANQLTAKGEFSRQDAYQSCWAFVHDLSIEQALDSEDPIVKSFAILDSRVGRRRLATLDRSGLHPLADYLLELRLAPDTMLTPAEYKLARQAELAA